MVPTLAAARGVKGHRPVVGTRGCKDLLYVLCVVNPISAATHSNTLGSPEGAKKKTGKGKARRMQEAFADHLRHVGGVYPRHKYPGVVILIDDAPWHRGKEIDRAPAENPRLEFKRLPSYSPQLSPIERLRKKLRRRATPNRLFDSPTDLTKSIRASPCYFQAVRGKVRSMREPRQKATAK